jgi:hypothetical protein
MPAYPPPTPLEEGEALAAAQEHDGRRRLFRGDSFPACRWNSGSHSRHGRVVGGDGGRPKRQPGAAHVPVGGMRNGAEAHSG